MLKGDIFESLNKFTKKWIIDFGNDQSNEPCPSRPKCLRGTTGGVSEFLDYLPYTSSKLSIDIRHPACDSRDCCDRHASQTRYVVYVRTTAMRFDSHGRPGLHLRFLG